MKSILVGLCVSGLTLLSACAPNAKALDNRDEFAGGVEAKVFKIVKMEEHGRAIEYSAQSSSGKAVGLGLVYISGSEGSEKLQAGNAVTTGNIAHCSMAFISADEKEQFFTPTYDFRSRVYRNNNWQDAPHPLYGICMAIDVSNPPKVMISADRKSWRIGGTTGKFVCDDITDSTC